MHQPPTVPRPTLNGPPAHTEQAERKQKTKADTAKQRATPSTRMLVVWS